MRISYAGVEAFLLDMSEGPFLDDIQTRIWSLENILKKKTEIQTVILGANNLLATFDCEKHEAADIRQILHTAWEQAGSAHITPRELVISVTYGGPDGEDLPFVAETAGLSEREIVALHTGATYRVAMVGFSPGFGYLTGVPKPLAIPRRNTPRVSVEQKSVCLGGGFTAVTPSKGPSGWHILGKAHCPDLFDVTEDDPCLLRAGDIVRFVSA
ncbi:5-oxoprolinase subunit PxpB [Acetobacter sp.]|jgi:KipI family sensor histidine kinase inhibitor|uniref:5-oxoprolinase subunit PxpB n=1 Tax=Acetobacter sp. TaxID=440 RepID=UPI0025BCC9BE|nr:5-oxoprolinase subunit PxpB [Acetobacter sp.]MCH4089914.1 5-oxoprolinase subunit PxpB [Acetobacter sp.]MCI1298610.1 5-oxoprolinase subunit PxpB [Acetobacter sp.]MCI1315175.1 5-oxoprolinase subunit PxpB [Acetobacter sp.]